MRWTTSFLLVALASVGLILPTASADPLTETAGEGLVATGALSGSASTELCVADGHFPTSLRISQDIQPGEDDGGTVHWHVSYAITGLPCAPLLAGTCQATEPYPEGLDEAEGECTLGDVHLHDLVLDQPPGCEALHEVISELSPVCGTLTADLAVEVSRDPGALETPRLEAAGTFTGAAGGIGGCDFVAPPVCSG